MWLYDQPLSRWQKKLGLTLNKVLGTKVMQFRKGGWYLPACWKQAKHFQHFQRYYDKHFPSSTW